MAIPVRSPPEDLPPSLIQPIRELATFRRYCRFLSSHVLQGTPYFVNFQLSALREVFLTFDAQFGTSSPSATVIDRDLAPQPHGCAFGFATEF